MTRRLLVVGCVLALLIAGGWYTAFRPSRAMSVSAEFPFADGIFPGSRVAVLGVPVGRVEEVRPRGEVVRVRMSLPADFKVPREAHAFIVNPAVISDRYIELGPAYRGGPAMADGTTIPVTRTHAPIRWDRLSRSLDRLLTALGPGSGAPLGSLVHSAAAATAGTGPQIRAAIHDVAQASDVLADGRGDIGAVLDNVDRLLQLLMQHRSTIDSLADTTARISGDFQAQQEQLTGTLEQLTSVLDEVDRLVRAHGDRLTGDVGRLAQVSGTLVQHQQQLAETLDTLPLAMDNLGRTITPDERMRLRLDISTNLSQFDLTARLCRQLPLPLCDGAGIVNPIPFPPELDPLSLLANGGGGR